MRLQKKTNKSTCLQKNTGKMWLTRKIIKKEA